MKLLDLKDIRNLSKIFGEFLDISKSKEDELALQDIVKGLSLLSEISGNEVINILNSKPGLINTMCELLEHPNIEIYKKALRFLGSSLSVDNEAILSQVMDSNLIDKLMQVLFSQCDDVVKEALWTLSNLTANGPSQTMAFARSSTANRVIHLSTGPTLNL